MGCGIINKRLKVSSSNNNQLKILNSQNLIKNKNIKSQMCFVTKINKDIHDDYKVLTKIGSGAFGQIYKIEDKATGIIRAMKIIKKEEIVGEIEKVYSNEKNDYFLNEIDILKKLDHPNIIKIYDYYTDEKNIFIVLEYFSGGDLFEEISKWKIHSEEKACSIIYQILQGVNYMHSKSVIHRDLKPENIILEKIYKNNLNNNSLLFDTQKKENRPNNLLDTITNYASINQLNVTNNINNQVNLDSSHIFNDNSLKKNIINENQVVNINLKIIDFGSGKILDKINKLSSKIGTPHYVAPELITKTYDEKVDIWACGVIFYKMLVGYLPFRGSNIDDILNAIIKGKYDLNSPEWRNISYESKHLIKCMLTYNPTDRISAFDVLNSVWLKNITKSINTNLDKDFKNLKITLDNIRTNNSISKLREASFNFLIHYYSTSKETEKLKNVFQNIDTNKDGKISFYEFKESCNNIYSNDISEIELRMLMENLDIDKSGYIEYKEFIKAFINKKIFMDENKLKFAFERFDLNKNGKLSKNEIIQIFNYYEESDEILKDKNLLTQKNIQNYEKNKDIDSSSEKSSYDDDITYEEFKQIMMDYLENYNVYGNTKNLNQKSLGITDEINFKKIPINNNLNFMDSNSLFLFNNLNLTKNISSIENFDLKQNNIEMFSINNKLSNNKISNNDNYKSTINNLSPENKNLKDKTLSLYNRSPPSILSDKVIDNQLTNKLNFVSINEENDSIEFLESNEDENNSNICKIFGKKENKLFKFDNSLQEKDSNCIIKKFPSADLEMKNNYAGISKLLLGKNEKNNLNEKDFFEEKKDSNIKYKAKHCISDYNNMSENLLCDVDSDFLKLQISKSQKNKEIDSKNYIENINFYLKKIKKNNFDCNLLNFKLKTEDDNQNKVHDYSYDEIAK